TAFPGSLKYFFFSRKSKYSISTNTRYFINPYSEKYSSRCCTCLRYRPSTADNEVNADNSIHIQLTGLLFLVPCILCLACRKAGWQPYICCTKIVQLKKIRVGIVNYLNTKPLLYGLERPTI